MKIHQLVAGFSKHDAISNEVQFLQKTLMNWGYESSIYAPQNHIHPNLKEKAYDYSALNISQNDTLIYHFSMGSKATDLFKKLNCKKILRYHNITPAHFFKNINQEKMLAAQKGRQELAEIKDIPNFCLADSAYNQQELIANGFNNTRVLPLSLNSQLLNQQPNLKILQKYKDKAINFLFVGRLVPNKKFEDIIKTFYFYNKTINQNSRLFLIGSHRDLEKYYTYLKIIIEKLQLPNIIFTGDIPQKDLNSYYQISHLFLCMSEHEGFCVPLLEAMHFNLPIVAFNKAGIPYTLKGTGILLQQKKHKYVAELIDILLQNNQLKEKIIQKQKLHLNNFTEQSITKQFQAFLNEHITK